MFWQGIMYDVTQQRESEERARETETRYRALVEQLPAIVYSGAVTGDSLAVTYINSRVERDPRRDPAEWIEDPQGNWVGRIHPDDREMVESVNALARANRRTVLRGIPDVRAGRPARVAPRRGRSRTRRGGKTEVLAGVMTDITARREAENSLAEAEARYRALVEQTPTITYLDAIERSAVHPVHEPAIDRDPRIHAAGLVRRRRSPRQARAPGGRGSRRPRAGVGRRARRHLPAHREGRTHRVDPRSSASHRGRRGAGEVLAGRADRRHGAPARRGAGAGPGGGTRDRPTPPRRRRDEEHLPAGRLPRPSDAARRHPGPGRHHGARGPGAADQRRCATFRAGSRRTPASSTGS